MLLLGLQLNNEGGGIAAVGGASPLVLLVASGDNDMGRDILKDATNESTVIRIIDSTTFLPEQTVEHTTPGLDLWFRREGAARVAITAVALVDLTTAHTDGGIEHIDDGYYRIDPPDASFATGADGVQFGGAVTDMVVIGTYHTLVDAAAAARVVQAPVKVTVREQRVRAKIGSE